VYAMNWIRENLSNVIWGIIVAAGGIWLLIHTLKQSTGRGLLIVKFVVTASVLWFIIKNVIPEAGMLGYGAIHALIMMLLCGGVLAVTWRGSIIDLIANPFTSMYDGGSEAPDKKPFYSIANAKRKRGLYHEAVGEVRKQLDNFPNDFEGVMLLASIQAENMNDLQAAENTLNHFCDRPKAPDNQVAAAWTTMADWHLKFSLDAEAARASLQKIIARFPETELALRAEQRLAHLVEAEKLLLEQHDRPTMVVPEGVHNLGLRDSAAIIQPEEIEPDKLAAAHVKHLAAHPHDSEVREKLAVIYAKDFQRLDLATAELLQLINEPRHSPKQIAGWLNQLANFQVELGSDIEVVRSTLQALVERFPDLPVADPTRRRLARLNSEFKGKEKTPGVQLGVYEQNIGLKYGSPRKL
jgi:hypothetical protein